MGVITLPAEQILANVERQLAWQVIPPIVQYAEIRMTAPAGQWPNNIDDTRHVKIWGLQIDVPGDPRWWLYEGDPFDSEFMRWAQGADGKVYDVPKGDPHPEFWMPFGRRLKDGTMPRVSLTGALRSAMRVRVAFLTDANVTLGAVITTVP